MVGFPLSSHLPDIPANRSQAGAAARTESEPATGITERQRAISRLLGKTGRVELSEIANRFGVSAATARRDAAFLVITGAANRTHGALTPAARSRGEPYFLSRAATRTDTKEHIARKAMALLPTEGSVFVDAGTTCFAVGRLLITRPKLRIFTNSIPLLALASDAQAVLIGIGGDARRASLALTGGFTQPGLATVRFDAAVIGASGLDLTHGAYTSELHEAAVKAEAIRRASLRVLVADAEKWNRPTGMHFAPWSAFSTLVTNHDLSREMRDTLAASKVNLQLTGLFSRLTASRCCSSMHFASPVRPTGPTVR